MASTKPNRAYPALPGAGAGIALLEALREAVEIHERRTGNKLDSFVRLGELIELGVIAVLGEQIVRADDTPSGAVLQPNTALLNRNPQTFTGENRINQSLRDLALLAYSDYAVANKQANITSITYGVSGGGTLHVNHANGTFANPSATLSGEITGGIGSRAYHSGGAFQLSSPAAIHWQVTENQTPSASGMWLRFLTTPKGSAARAERGGITDNGTMWIHDGAVYDPLSNAQTLPVADAAFVASGGGTKGAAFVAVSYDVTTFTAGFRGLGARGSPASPAPPQANDFLCFMGGHGFDGSAFTPGTKALVGFKAGETFSSTNQGTYITLETTANGSTTRAERLRISSAAVVSDVPIRLKGYTVATLPVGTQGDTAYVTDALAPTFLGVLTGGGAVVTPAFYDGTNWVAG